MSPQIVDYHRYTYKTDIWSLGVIYYELLTGQYPFNGEKMSQLAKNLQNGFYIMKMPYKPSMEALHVLTSCLNQNEDERVSIEELAENPYFAQEGYLPHYLNESSAQQNSTGSDQIYTSRSLSPVDDRSYSGPRRGSFNMVLSSKDSRFTKRLSETLTKVSIVRATETMSKTNNTTYLGTNHQ